MSASPDKIELPALAGTARARIRAILDLALPIVGGMLSQNLLNLVDVAMVGRLGGAALGAVGIGGFASVMAAMLVVGVASGGVQPMAARRVGEGRGDEAAVPLNGGLLLALCLGLPFSAAMVWVTPYLFPYLNGDPAVVAHGVPYVQVRLLAVAAIAVNFSFRGYWNGVKRSGLYFRTLVLMHGANILLDWVLIFGKLGAPALGTLGAGIASTAATCLGAFYYFALGARHARRDGFLRRTPDGATLRSMLRLGVPTGLQQFFFFLGWTTLFWIVGQVGTIALAAATVLTNMMLVAILPAVGLGMAAGTLVGQALGRRDAAEAKRWGWEVCGVAVAFTVVIAAPMVLTPDLVLAIFLTEPSAFEVARLPLQVAGATLVLDVVGLVLYGALAGAGDAPRLFLASAAMQWGVALPGAWLVGARLGYGLLAIWLVICAWRLLQSAVFGLRWQRGAWAKIRL